MLFAGLNVLHIVGKILLGLNVFLTDEDLSALKIPLDVC